MTSIKTPGLAWILVSALLAAAPACGGDDDGDDDAPAPDAAGAVDAGAPDGAAGDFVPLLQASWTRPPGEGYYCSRVTVQEDLYVSAFRPLAPVGTHHTALTIDTGSGPDGEFDCEASTVGQQILFGSGVGTGDFVMPEGVAFKIEAGQKLLLNLHLFNTGDAPITGVSGTEVKLLDPADVVAEAEATFVGTFNINLQPNTTGTANAQCTMTADTTVFATFPHMHQLGTHMRAVANPAGGSPIVLSDRPYSFEEQLNYMLDPMVSLSAGDVVQVECTYNNTTNQVVTFGDSSTAEMCFFGLYRFPRSGAGFVCTN